MIVELTQEHALYVCQNMRESDFRECMETIWQANDGDNAALIASHCMNANGPKWVAINREGVAVVIGGVALTAPCVGTAWMIGTDEWLSVALEVSRFCKSSMKTMFDSGVVHRIHAFSATFHTESHRWLELVGLTAGPTLKQWGKNKEDFILFEALSSGESLCV